MISFPASLIGSAYPSLDFCRIGYQTWLRDLLPSAIVVSSETAEGPKDAPLRPDTAEFWKASAMPATWLADLGVPRDVDYVGIAGHTIGSSGAAVEVRTSLDAEFNDYLRLRNLDGNFASTPDTAANSIVADLDFDVELAVDVADAPGYFLDFVGDWTASIAKVAASGTFARAGATATRVNAIGYIEAQGANVMRQGFDPVTKAARGFLVEEARTNLLLRSDDLSNAIWVTNLTTVTADASAGPTGSVTMEKLVETATSGEHLLDQTIAAAAGTWTISAFVKAAERTKGFLVAVHVGDGVGTSQCSFDLAAGTIQSPQGRITASSIAPYRDGIYRLVITFTTTASCTSLRTRLQLADAAGAQVYLGDITKGMYWGAAQMEAGAFATSYIPTTTTTVARAADVAALTSISSWFNALAGTLYAKWTPGRNVGGSYVASLSNNTNSELLAISASNANGGWIIIDGGITQGTNSSAGPALNTPIALALAYAPNDVESAMDGGVSITDTVVTLPTVDRLYLGTDGQATQQLGASLGAVAYYPTRRAFAALKDFSRQTYRCIASKWIETGNQRAWALCLSEHGSLILFVSTDGTAAGIREFHSIPLTIVEGARFWIRVKLDIIAGADSVCTFQTSTDGVAFSTLGAAVTQASIAAIFNSTAPVEVGSFNGGVSEFEGRLFQLRLRSGLDGAVVNHFNAANLSGETGETWTISATGATPAVLQTHGLGGASAPADDTPIIRLDAMRLARFVKVILTGPVAPRVAVLYAGSVLAMPVDMTAGGFTPASLSRQTVLHQSLSKGGQFLGQGFRRMGVSGAIGFKYLDPDWLRSTFEPFVKSARRFPYFIAWWPAHYPDEVSFVWTEKDIVPTYMGFIDSQNQARMEVNWSMQGTGNE